MAGEGELNNTADKGKNEAEEGEVRASLAVRNAREMHLEYADVCRTFVILCPSFRYLPLGVRCASGHKRITRLSAYVRPCVQLSRQVLLQRYRDTHPARHLEQP